MDEQMKMHIALVKKAFIKNRWATKRWLENATPEQKKLYEETRVKYEKQAAEHKE